MLNTYIISILLLISFKGYASAYCQLDDQVQSNWFRSFQVAEDFAIVHRPESISFKSMLYEFQVPAPLLYLPRQDLGGIILRDVLILAVNSTIDEFRRGILNAGLPILEEKNPF